MKDKQNLQKFYQPAIDELNDSSRYIDDSIDEQLNSIREMTIQSISSSSDAKVAKPNLMFNTDYYKTSLALAIPLLLIASIIFSIADLKTSTMMLNDDSNYAVEDLYADIDLLDEQQQLDFLVELDISSWTENDS